MAAVGLSDVFKYGTRFLAHLLVVVLLGVVLVLVGDVVGEFITGGLTDPGIRSNLGTTAYAGIAISVAGVLVTVAGLGGLLFKLVADGTAVGTRSVIVDADGLGDAPTNAASDDEHSDADAASSDEATDTASPESAGEQPQPPRRPTETTAPSTESGSAGQNRPAASQDPVTQESTDRQTTPSEQFERAAGQQSAASSEPEQTSQTAPSGEPAPPQSGEPEQSPAPDESATGSEQSEAPSNPDEPPEWTPPDPAEFERQQAENADDRAQRDTEDAVDQAQRDTEDADDRVSQDRPASPLDEHRQDSFDDDTRVVDGDQFDDTESGATTWDDLQTPTESTAEPVDEPVTEEPQSTGQEDWGSPEQFGDESGPEVDESIQSDDSDDENRYEDEEPSDDDSGFSFETSGDGDPLSDALDDS